ncbi:serine/threonine-protein kinase pim-2-like [Sinocyclocheilus rhinocerous]|uniref:serine/threonine-protein kinase pim-2-like n=1 Tax=Sinocyclocheilus rhinocerous TaxID=307959 RepID=UPI0007BA8DCF|nr:PREDICTED: serine/threonine-protein kinase pim-2-like [Sinocyclocheilus rhinocerous]
MENSATEKPSKHKNSLCAFFKKTWHAVKSTNQCRRQGSKVALHQPVSDTDSADPQCGPYGLEPAAHWHLADLQPGPSGLEPTTLQDQTDPPPRPSSVTPMNCDEKPADPEPAEENQTNTKKKHICAFFKRTWRAVKRAATQRKKHNKVAPLCPQPDTDSADHQPDPNVFELMALQDLTDHQPDPTVFELMALQDLTDHQPYPNVLELTALQDPADPPEDPQSGSSDPDRDPDASKMTPVVGPSGLVPAGLQDPADPLPGPSALDPVAPKFPGASKHRQIADQTRFRAACFTDSTPAPFDEIYEVGEEIGEGGFGTVYEGISKFLREQVAIKFIPKCETDLYIEIPGCSEPLFAEVALNLLLKRPPLSPYIVHMLEWFEEEDRFILILEYPQPCKDLLKFMVNNMQRLDESQTRRLMHQAVLGAKHCLDRGVFHRDIKLNNFLINTKTNQVKLIDFGCSDLVKSSGYLGDFTGGVCPPEYYKDLKYEAGPTTVWSLGVMMYSVVCRCQPFNSLEDMKHGSLSFNVRVSTELQDLISRCLAYHPTERATVEEILQHEWFQQGQMSGGAQDQVVTADAPNWPR